MKKTLTFVLILLLFPFLSFAQETFPVNGVKDKRVEAYAFKNAAIVVDYQTKIENADIFIKNGIIESVGRNINVPEGTVIIDLEGKYIYPSLIDIYTNYGLPKVSETTTSRGARGTTPPQVESGTKGAYNWNEAVKSYFNAVDKFTIDSKSAADFRKLGIGAVLCFNPDGIARGSSALVSLAEMKDNKVVIDNRAAAHYSFNKGSSKQNYPGSLMGSIALIRQTYIDAEWYKSQTKENLYDQSLEAWNDLQSIPQIFDVSDKFNLLRADKVGNEFGVQYIIKGNGDEYQLIDEIKAANASLIVPVNFPGAFDVKDPYDALMIPLEDLKHWELAPANLAILAKNNINFAITSYGLKNKTEFWSNVRKAIQYGLDESTALKALTYTPAKLINAENKIGSLKKGMLANFLITSGNIFDENVIIYENWVQGNKYVLKDIDIKNYSGIYDLKVGDKEPYKLEISGKIEKPALKIIISDTIKISVTSTFDKKLVTLNFNPDPKDKKAGVIRLSGWIEDKKMSGGGQLPDGKWITWSAEFKSELKDKKDSVPKKKENNDIADLGKVTYPFLPYGSEEKLQPQDLLIRNATVWTNEAEGIIENTDVLVKDGKILKIGKNLNEKDVLEIDGTGKHLTSGVIDEHSHIAVSGGVNEGSQAVSAEVRIGDVMNSEDINIYRQLSGGVTACQVLHGSANPIGGQSAIIKHRWGKSPEELKIKGTVGFLKHALGENVKQSRSPSWLATRYPQTRMGVEQIIKDAYIKAKDYMKEWDNYNSLSAKEKSVTHKPRKDLELEALADVLNKKSFVTCHTYVQSETNMIMKLGKELGFKAHTMIHNTEGYKIADKMRKHGAAGSIFSDWWAFKYEVYDAIPYNAALHLHEGVLTCIHSDNAELARRLNQEAAKAVKYGNVSEEEAWKLVTLNPAKILHLDDRMGSIKVGKDADIVLWSDNPLSIYAIAEKTIVDGIIYYDVERNAKLKEANNKERARLIKKMLKEKSGGTTSKISRANQQYLWDDEEVFDFFKGQNDKK